MRIIIINGPNLNLTGNREPNIYGHTNFDKYLIYLKEKYSKIEIDYYQSNIEGEIIDKLQFANNEFDGVILNCGGYSHTSVAIADAIAAINISVIEVHMSNIFSRESYRQNLITASKSSGFISGFGLQSYELALIQFLICNSETEFD